TPASGARMLSFVPFRGSDDDAEKRLRRQTGTADERAADLVRGEQRGSIVRFDGPSIEDAHLLARIAVDGLEPSADRAVHSADVLHGRRAAGSDRPDRLIGYGHLFGRRVLAGQRAFELRGHDLLGVPRIALGFGLTDAHD